MIQRALIRSMFFLPLLAGCGALPFDTSVNVRDPGGGRGNESDANATGFVSANTPAALLELWRGFGNDLGLAPRTQIQFSGTMLSWHPAASGVAIARMTGEVARLRRIWAEYYETKFHGIQEAQQIVDGLTARLRQARREVQALPATRDMQLAAAAGWWDAQVALHERTGVVDPRGGAAHARHVFERFCDAKLWEFAVTPQMMAPGYQARPVAFGPCEDLYFARGYLGGEACRISRDDSLSKSGAWFDCFWSEGVMRTHAFHARYSIEKQSRIRQMLEDGYLREALSSADRAPDARSSILGMKRARKKTFARFEGDPEEDALRELFVSDRDPGRDSANLATPRLMLDFVEEQPRSQAGLDPDLAFFPRAAHDEMAFIVEREAHSAIAALGKRDFVTFNSTSDFLWNGQSLTMPWSTLMDAAEIHPRVHPWVAMVVDEMPRDFAVSIQGLRSDLGVANDQLSGLLARQTQVDREFSYQAARTLAASVEPGIAQAFWPEVNLMLTAPGAAFGAPAAGGVAFDGTQVSVALSRDVPPVTGVVSTSRSACDPVASLCAWLDASTGALRIHLSPPVLQSQGFARRVPAPQDIDARTRGFNELPPGLDADTSLDMILYLGRIGRTPVISGRTILRKDAGGGDLPDGLAFEVEGEVSFLRL